MEIHLDECFECGTKEHIQNHHVVPRSKGGKKTIPLCNTCHGIVHGRKNGVQSDPLRLSRLAKEGQRKAMERGVHIGRPVGAKETKDKFFSKYPKVVKLISEGYSQRCISSELKISPKTIKKVKDIMIERGMIIPTKKITIKNQKEDYLTKNNTVVIHILKGFTNKYIMDRFEVSPKKLRIIKSKMKEKNIEIPKGTRNSKFSQKFL
jgi:DNA-binding CsgD family transcriptional regulator